MPFWDLINLNKIRRAIVYAFYLILCMWFQTMILARVEIFGVKAMFIPVVIVAIGAAEGGVWGCVWGMIAGFFCDGAMLPNEVLQLVVFAALGFGSGVLMDFVLSRSFTSYLLLCVPALLVYGFCQIVPLWIFKDAAFGPLCVTALIQAALSLPFAVPTYFIVKAIARVGSGA